MIHFLKIFLTFFLLGYLIGSFLNASFDCSTWEYGQRIVIVVLVSIISIFVTLILDIENKTKWKNQKLPNGDVKKQA